MFSYSEKETREPLLSSQPPRSSKHHFSKKFLYSCLTVLIALFIIDALALGAAITYWFSISSSKTNLSPEAIGKCAWPTLQKHVSLLDVAQIPKLEFLSRQKTLASALKDAGVSAFVTEPSASSTYYANVSTTYDLSERPFLLVISSSGQFSYLAPKFELGRIAGLEMVYDSENGKRVIEWKEEESPYEVLKRELGLDGGKVMLDEHARFMIASGLEGVGVDVVPMSPSIQALRSVKSANELAILKGINAFTLELVRSLQSCIKPGMTQETIRTAAHGLFTQAGIGGGFWAIVLFGEQAANPHGGSSGGELEEGEFVLIDIGSSFHGYGSDVTRTILPPTSSVSSELMSIWNTVHSAQSAAIELMKPNKTCSVVDAASRKVITDAGYGEFFTHRLGHGLGLEMHEHPYLNGANGESLKKGEVVTNEPGIYVTRKQAKVLGKGRGWGVRIEDAVLVTEDGGVVLTGARAKSPWEP